MKFTGIILALLFSLSVFAQANKEAVVATVGNKKITLDDFNKKYNEVKLKSINPPSKEQFLEELVRYELGLQEAEKRKFAQDPIVQELQRQVMYRALLEKDLGERAQKITVTDKEMEEYYKKNPEIRTSHILVEVKVDATPQQREEAKKRAEEIYSEVKKSKRPFEELVKLYSDDPISKQTGGDVGWQNRLTVTPDYYNSIYSMKVGEVRGLVETLYGYHIVKVTGRRSYENANKRTLRMAVFDQKKLELFNDYFDRLKKNYRIEKNPKLIQ